MKKNIKVVSVLLLLSIAIYGRSTKILQDTNVIIKIKAESFKHKILKSYFPATEIKLSSSGEGVLLIPLKKTFFVDFAINDSSLFTLLLDPGDDLVFNLNKGKFTGKGANRNNYLFKLQILINQFTKTVRKNQNDPQKFIAFCDSFELVYKSFHKKYSDSIPFTNKIDYLLKNYAYSTVLFEKEMYLHGLDQNEIDSLNLIERLSLFNNALCKDTLLIKTKPCDFLNFLFFNCKREIDDPIQLKEEELDMYNQKGINLYPAILFKKIKESTIYSEEIKEFLLFSNLSSVLASYGITPIIDSLSKMLKQTYPHSSHLANMVDRFQKMNHLTPGNPAPHLQGITQDGKVYSLEDFQGKVVFIDIWATWCSPCIAALPHTLELQEKFKTYKDVVFIFLANDNDGPWRKYLGLHLEFTGCHLRLRKAEDYPYLDGWQLTGIPRYILIGKQGKIIDAFIGITQGGRLKGLIEKALLEQ